MAEPFAIFWSDEPDGNVRHLAANGVTPEEAEAVLSEYFDSRERSRSRPDRWIVTGQTPSGRALAVVFELEPEEVVIPITAYGLED